MERWKHQQQSGSESEIEGNGGEQAAHKMNETQQEERKVGSNRKGTKQPTTNKEIGERGWGIKTTWRKGVLGNGVILGFKRS